MLENYEKCWSVFPKTINAIHLIADNQLIFAALTATTTHFKRWTSGIDLP